MEAGLVYFLELAGKLILVLGQGLHQPTRASTAANRSDSYKKIWNQLFQIVFIDEFS